MSCFPSRNTSRRSLDRLGAGTRSAPRDALVAASVDEPQRGKAFGLEGIGDNPGAFLGPLIDLVRFAWLAIDLRWVFYLALIPGLLALVMIPLVEAKPAAASAKAKVDLNVARFRSGYWRYLLVTALFGSGNSSNSFLILRTRDLGASLSGPRTKRLFGLVRGK